MSDNLPEDKQRMLEAKRAMNQAGSGSFNPEYKLEFTDQEARQATAIRDSILNEIADCMNSGMPAADARVLQLVERYRYEFIDQYLYLSTPIIILGLSSTAATLPENRQAYEAYCPGLAEYFSRTLRAYYDTLSAK